MRALEDSQETSECQLAGIKQIILWFKIFTWLQMTRLLRHWLMSSIVALPSPGSLTVWRPPNCLFGIFHKVLPGLPCTSVKWFFMSYQLQPFAKVPPLFLTHAETFLFFSHHFRSTCLSFSSLPLLPGSPSSSLLSVLSACSNSFIIGRIWCCFLRVVLPLQSPFVFLLPLVRCSPALISSMLIPHPKAWIYSVTPYSPSCPSPSTPPAFLLFLQCLMQSSISSLSSFWFPLLLLSLSRLFLLSCVSVHSS